jgi:hypothetical protein
MTILASVSRKRERSLAGVDSLLDQEEGWGERLVVKEGEDGVDLGGKLSVHSKRSKERRSVSWIENRKGRRKPNRVGEMMRAPISSRLRGVGLRRIFSMMGMTKASVLPEPVTA